MNALAQEKSPYLRQHATNPVHWFPWGESAFAKARAEKKPIFLSIGYSTCHWCHVMAHESFENPAIAEILNTHFVSIKVDREERPDVDHLYMLFVQATTGQGGWPMSVWLTPELKPFYGGTYFPPEDRWGRPGFATLLERIIEIWKNDYDSIQQQSQQILLNLGQTSQSTPASTLPQVEHLEQAFDQFADQFEPEYGGFSRAPKFPRPSTFNFLLRYADRPSTDPEERAEAREMVEFTLCEMAAGGIYDHLGGGFHRYSVDERWHVPHFEKMLYDQAQLVRAYLEGYQLTGNARFREVIRETLDYVVRDLTSPEGGFYAAEDADSLIEHGQEDHAEGAFYVWSHAEILEILGAELGELFILNYGVKPEGNAPEGSDPHGEFTGVNILIQQKVLKAEADQLAAARRTLFAVRAKRPRPHRDEKILTAWNGLMISAFAQSGAVLDSAADLAVAEKAAEFVLTQLRDSEGRLLRSYCGGAASVRGFASDYAFLIQGLLDLFEATGTVRWLREAWKLQQTMDQLFWDKLHGAYFEASDEDLSLLLRLKETYDGAEPAANSVAANNLLRFADVLGDRSLVKGATQIFQSAATTIVGSPSAVPQLLASLTRWLSTPVHVVVTGAEKDPQTIALVREVQAVFLPQKTFLQLRPGDPLEFLGSQAEFFAGLLGSSAKPTAFICEDLKCHQPVSDPEALRALLAPLIS